mgnify:CR=1 FL=1
MARCASQRSSGRRVSSLSTRCLVFSAHTKLHSVVPQAGALGACSSARSLQARTTAILRSANAPKLALHAREHGPLAHLRGQSVWSRLVSATAFVAFELRREISSSLATRTRAVCRRTAVRGERSEMLVNRPFPIGHLAPWTCTCQLSWNTACEVITLCGLR